MTKRRVRCPFCVNEFEVETNTSDEKVKEVEKIFQPIITSLRSENETLRCENERLQIESHRHRGE